MGYIDWEEERTRQNALDIMVRRYDTANRRTFPDIMGILLPRTFPGFAISLRVYRGSTLRDSAQNADTWEITNR